MPDGAWQADVAGARALPVREVPAGMEVAAVKRFMVTAREARQYRVFFFVSARDADDAMKKVQAGGSFESEDELDGTINIVFEKAEEEPWK